MKNVITLAQAEEMAEQANINGVEAFIRDHGKEHDRVTIQLMKESLMAAVIEQGTGTDDAMDQYLFSRIKRVANL